MSLSESQPMHPNTSWLQSKGGQGSHIFMVILMTSIKKKKKKKKKRETQLICNLTPTFCRTINVHAAYLCLILAKVHKKIWKFEKIKMHGGCCPPCLLCMGWAIHMKVQFFSVLHMFIPMYLSQYYVYFGKELLWTEIYFEMYDT